MTIEEEEEGEEEEYQDNRYLYSPDLKYLTKKDMKKSKNKKYKKYTYQYVLSKIPKKVNEIKFKPKNMGAYATEIHFNITNKYTIKEIIEIIKNTNKTLKEKQMKIDIELKKKEKKIKKYQKKIRKRKKESKKLKKKYNKIKILDIIDYLNIRDDDDIKEKIESYIIQ